MVKIPCNPFCNIQITAEMTNLLDDLDVRPVDYTPDDNSWAPSPGTPVPRECLQFLVQELVQFSSGDYAVFEVFDNLHDDDEDEQGCGIMI
jgi:hypothetical protein